jgi:hypothetical protein
MSITNVSYINDKYYVNDVEYINSYFTPESEYFQVILNQDVVTTLELVNVQPKYINYKQLTSMVDLSIKFDESTNIELLDLTYNINLKQIEDELHKSSRLVKPKFYPKRRSSTNRMSKPAAAHLEITTTCQSQKCQIESATKN